MTKRGRQCKWDIEGRTIAIRIPEDFKEEILKFARALERGRKINHKEAERHERALLSQDSLA